MSLKKIKIRGKIYWAYRDDKGRFIGTFKTKTKKEAKEKAKRLESLVKETKFVNVKLIQRYDGKTSRYYGKYQYFFEGFYKGRLIASVSSQHDKSYPVKHARSEALNNFYMALSQANRGEGNSDIDDGKIIFSRLRRKKEGTRYFKKL